MARTRSIKPAFFKNEILSFLPANDKLTFIGLWTLADRAGRLEDRPTRIKGELFPYFDMDVEAALCRLDQTGFIHRYESGGEKYISIVTFGKHQSPHLKEQASTIPAPDMHQTFCKSLDNNRDGHAPDMHGASTRQAHPSTLPPVLPSTLPPDLQNGALSRGMDFSSEMQTHLRTAGLDNTPDDLLAKLSQRAQKYKRSPTQAASVFLEVYHRAQRTNGIKDGVGYLLAAFDKAMGPVN